MNSQELSDKYLDIKTKLESIKMDFSDTYFSDEIGNMLKAVNTISNDIDVVYGLLVTVSNFDNHYHVQQKILEYNNRFIWLEELANGIYEKHTEASNNSSIH